MLLDVSKYEADIKERQQRIRIARQFKEPDRVPIAFGIGGSYYCWLFGYNIRDYYATPELQVEVQLKGLEWEYEELRADSCTRQGISYEAGPLGEALLFDLPVERPDNTSPRIVTVLESVRDIERLRIPEPDKNPRIKEFLKNNERFNAVARKMGVKLQLNERPRIDIHPPLSAACALMSPTLVYEYMYSEPNALQLLLDKMFEAKCLYIDYFDNLYGTKTQGSMGFADDNISQISAEMFRRWELPYYFKFKERYNLKHIHLHTDGPNDQHFKILADELKITSMDIGGYSSLDVAVRDMKGKVYIHGGLWCKDFYQPGGMTAVTKRKVLEAIRLAAPGGGFELAIGGETYVGVSPDAITECVRFVDHYGRYPIQITDKLIEEIAR